MQHFHHIRLQFVIKSLGNLAASLLKTSETILIGSKKENKFFFSVPTDWWSSHRQHEDISNLRATVSISDGIRHHQLIIHLHGSYLTFQHQESVSSQLCLGIERKKR